MLPGARTQKGNCVREATSKIMPTTFTAAFFPITNSRANPNVYQLMDRQTDKTRWTHTMECDPSLTKKGNSDTCHLGKTWRILQVKTDTRALCHPDHKNTQ